MTTPDVPHVRHKAIDGWRAIAALCVVLAHATNYRFGAISGLPMHYLQRFSGPLAELGVQIFFIISGYIITSLLIREENDRGAISKAAFYARRTFRIIPPLLAYYAAVVLLSSLSYISLPIDSLASSATFTCNTGIVDCFWWVAHTWSLAVEEQFYLVWPLLFSISAGRFRPALLATVLTICLVGAAVQAQVFHGNFTSFACIAAGALYATSAKVRQLCQRATHPFVWTAVAALLIVGPLTRLSPFTNALLPILVLYFVFAGNALSWVRWTLETKPFQLVGRGSYSLYLWQQLFLAEPALYALSPPPVIALPIVVLGSVVLIEQPFIKVGRLLSERLSGRGARATAFS